MYVRSGVGAVTASASVDVNVGGGTSAPKTYAKGRPLLNYFLTYPNELGALQKEDADNATLRVVNAATKIGILKSSYGWANVSADLVELVAMLKLIKSQNKFDYQNRIGSAIAYAYDKAIEAEKAAAAKKPSIASQFTLMPLTSFATKPTAPATQRSATIPITMEPSKLPWIIGGVVLLLAGGGAYYYMSTKKKKPGIA